jgi:TonB family protein
MKRNFLLPLLLLLFSFSTSAFAQAEVAAAPVVWEKYKIGRHELSIDLPKMPIRNGSQDMCSNFQKHSFFSYADETMYEVTVVQKIDLPIPQICRERRLFSDSTLAARLAEIRSSKPEMSETSVMQSGRQAYKFAGGEDVRWIIPDMEKDRWIELGVIRRDDRKSFEDSFVKSLDLAVAAGKEVGKGAPTVIGDPVQAADIKLLAVPDEGDAKPGAAKQIVANPLRMIVKPKAVYTDVARRSNTQGTVRLRITLLANGSVGEIAVLKDLPNGLTEQALEAARKIVFLPARINGVPVSKSVTVEYGFNIY